MQETVALIPVREGSGRIEEKNFRPFAKGLSLFELKIEQVKAATCFDRIYVSSNSRRVKKICSDRGVEYIERSPIMCTAAPRWDEVVCSILENIPGNPIVAWTLATSPLFDRYTEAVAAFREPGEHDSLYAAHKIQEYMVDLEGRPLLYSFGFWHPYTNEIPGFYIVNDAFYIAEKSLQLQMHYWIGRKAKIFETTKVEGIDINFPEDFELAQAAFELQAKRQQ